LVNSEPACVAAANYFHRLDALSVVQATPLKQRRDTCFPYGMVVILERKIKGKKAKGRPKRMWFDIKQ